MSNLMILSGIIFWTLFLLFSVLLMHELIHYAFIKVFKKELTSFKINLFGGKVTYINDGKYGEIFLISAAPNIILPILGFFLLQADLGLYYDLFAILCLANLLNFLPFIEDGRVMLYCVLKVWGD